MPVDLLSILSPRNLVLFIVVFTRMGGMLSSAPLFSTFPIPRQVKAWFLATVTFLIFPIIMVQSGFQMPTSIPELFIILLKEFMIGYLIGFLANLVFIGVEMAAEIISLQMGLSMAQALDPASGEQTPVIAQAYSFMAAMVFLGINAHQQLFYAVYKSFQAIPIGYGFLINGTIVQQVLYLTGQMFTIAFGVALPIFAVLLMTDVLLGFTAKMMPQMNIFMVAMPLKIYIGLLLILLLLKPTIEYITVLFGNFIQHIMVIF